MLAFTNYPVELAVRSNSKEHQGIPMDLRLKGKRIIVTG
ncbi:MAG: hypothetical protein ACJAR0_004689, partial [Candidatus Azotimanducaceae bacterium]